jgi:hypothetical protein
MTQLSARRLYLRTHINAHPYKDIENRLEIVPVYVANRLVGVAFNFTRRFPTRQYVNILSGKGG